MKIGEITVYLGLGSNVGDRMGQLQFAVDNLKGDGGQKVCRCSRVYETTPWGGVVQALYLNAVVEIETVSSPEELLKIVKQIEIEAGRGTREQRWVERELDIDLLIFGEVTLHSTELILPHQFLLNRRFVLTPLSEIAPDLNIPGTNITVKSALDKCDDKERVKLYQKALRI